MGLFDRFKKVAEGAVSTVAKSTKKIAKKAKSPLTTVRNLERGGFSKNKKTRRAVAAQINRIRKEGGEAADLLDARSLLRKQGFKGNINSLETASAAKSQIAGDIASRAKLKGKKLEQFTERGLVPTRRRKTKSGSSGRSGTGGGRGSSSTSSKGGRVLGDSLSIFEGSNKTLG